MKYKYETHLHTSPVSACASADVDETVRAYHEMGYAGIFITNHYLDGNIAYEVRALPFDEQLDFYYRAYTRAKRLGDELGIDVFFATEIAYSGTDFLIYGLDVDWYRAHPEILTERKSAVLAMMREAGALIIQAHPFREASYIDHIRLFPRLVDGVEIHNGCRTDFENRMAAVYCREYGLIPFAGSDNHVGGRFARYAGIETPRRITDEQDFIRMVRSGEATLFYTQKG